MQTRRSEEADLLRVIDALAFLSSLAALVVLGGGGGALLAVSVSGERSTGALLAFCGLVAFVLTVALIFVPSARFRDPTWRAAAVAAALIAAMPVAGIAAAALRFAGLPFGSPIPLVDWAVFAFGLGLALGAIAILALGIRRARDREPLEEEDYPSVIHMQQIREAQLQLRTALRSAERAEPEDYDDGDIRVRRV